MPPPRPPKIPKSLRQLEDEEMAARDRRVAKWRYQQSIFKYVERYSLAVNQIKDVDV